MAAFDVRYVNLQFGVLHHKAQPHYHVLIALAALDRMSWTGGLRMDGRGFNIIDEFTKEALTIRVERKLNSTDVVDALTDLLSCAGPAKSSTLYATPRSL